MQDSYNIAFEKEVMERLIKIESKLDNYEKLKETAYQNQRDIIELRKESEMQDKKITAIQDTNKWLARTIGATLIAIAVGVIVACIRMGMGG